MDQMIKLKDVLLYVRENPTPFSLSWWTCDVRQRTGGELKNADRAILTTTKPRHSRISKGQSNFHDPRHSKSPNHRANHTLNIRVLPSGDIKKVHAGLIETFNGKKVIW